jgi:hypothetical protein
MVVVVDHGSRGVDQIGRGGVERLHLGIRGATATRRVLRVDDHPGGSGMILMRVGLGRLMSRVGDTLGGRIGRLGGGRGHTRLRMEGRVRRAGKLVRRSLFIHPPSYHRYILLPPHYAML